eukprot:scaffold99000_cov21-Cyclotella_meneghiniana.AAC.3
MSQCLYQMVSQGGDWNSFSTMVLTSLFMSHLGEPNFEIPLPVISQTEIVCPETLESISLKLICSYVLLYPNKWLDKVEIEIHCPQWPQHVCKTFTSSLVKLRLCVMLESLNPFYCSLTVLMSHCLYDKWLDKVEIGIHCPQWSQQVSFCAMEQPKFEILPSTCQTKIVSAETLASILITAA